MRKPKKTKPLPKRAPKAKAKRTAKSRSPAPVQASREPAAAAVGRADQRVSNSAAKAGESSGKSQVRADRAASASASSSAAKPRTRADKPAPSEATGSPAKPRTRADKPAPSEATGSPAKARTRADKPARKRRLTARDWSKRSSPVVEILDDPYPIGALRRFLDSIKGTATQQQTQIALSAAQLLLLPIARESRGGVEVKELVDLVLERWTDWESARDGFHGQEFLRNALAAIGVDRKRLARLEAHIPAGASTDLLFDLAAAYAVARDKVAMMRTAEAALAAGAPPSDFRREPNFAPYTADPDLAELLAQADLPAIEVDIDPYIGPVRTALDILVGLLTELGANVELRPPVRPSAILEAERAAKLSLPNDYRALLTVTNGMRLWDREFLGTADYRGYTLLTARAHQFLHADYAVPGVSDCVPLANWGRPNDWVLYDPRGRLRSGTPGYVAVLQTEQIALDGLVAALEWLTESARDVLRTN